MTLDQIKQANPQFGDLCVFRDEHKHDKPQVGFWMGWYTSDQIVYEVAIVKEGICHVNLFQRPKEGCGVLSFHGSDKAAAEHAAKCLGIVGKWEVDSLNNIYQVTDYVVIDENLFAVSYTDGTVGYKFTEKVLSRQHYDTREQAGAALKEQTKPDLNNPLATMKTVINFKANCPEPSEKKWWEREPCSVMPRSNNVGEAYERDRKAIDDFQCFSGASFQHGWATGFSRGRWFEQERFLKVVQEVGIASSEMLEELRRRIEEKSDV